MKNSIRVLHLEDSPRDAEIIQERLEAEGLACDIVRVDTQERFAAALAAGSFDVIFCDYNLPGYDGISALELAREKNPGTPVMLISGSLGEEEAVKCLQHGATDYLMKQRLDRLPRAVTRALAEAEDHRKRRQAEAALRESEERFRQLAERSSEGFWFLGLKPERTLYVSPAMEKIWGLPLERFYQDPRAWAAAIHPKDQRRVLHVWEACLHGQSSRFESEYRVVRPDGSVCWVLDSGTPIRGDAGDVLRISCVVRDITERKELEGQMLRAQRLESIGSLASGVAHDLNNALAPIMMAAELLHLEFPGRAAQYVEIIRASARRGAEMVKQLTTFARGAEGERLILQPRHLLNEMENLIKRTFPKHIQLQPHHAKNLQTIRGDATQLHQVLLNLCVNARDAMPNGGTLTLRAENVEIDTVYSSAVPEAKPGPYVVWRVGDTGTGIPPAILDRIFEPFFTTKGPDKGTGLGLSTVLGIIKGHGGFVRVYSVLGQGSTFAIYLPAAGDLSGDTSLLTKAEPTFRGQGEAILVVDDEPAVRAVTRAALTALNFKVLTASDGTTALTRVTEQQADIRAVITDLHMPGINGLDFIRLIKARLPQASVIVASGRLEEREGNEFKKMGVSALLEKPFTHEKLLAALKTVFFRPSNSPHV